MSGTRLLSLAALAAVLGAGPAYATASFELRWTATSGTGAVGGTAISAAPGDVLTAVLLMTAGTEGILAYGVSARFDADLGNELDLVAYDEPSIVGGFTFPCSPFPTCVSTPPPQLTAATVGLQGTQESDDTQAGFLLSYEAYAFTLGPVLSDGEFEIGTMTFLVTPNLATDGVDVELGAFNGSYDYAYRNDGLVVDDVSYGGAAVNVPEPGTTALLGLGLLGLALAGVRAQRRRS